MVLVEAPIPVTVMVPVLVTVEVFGSQTREIDPLLVPVVGLTERYAIDSEAVHVVLAVIVMLWVPPEAGKETAELEREILVTSSVIVKGSAA
jgi:hypothetical protein